MNQKTFFKGVRLFCRSPFANLVMDAHSTPTAKASPDIRCDLCNATFDSSQQLGIHRFNVHSVKPEWGRFADSTHCIVCLREFHTKERVLNHIRYRSVVCRTNHIARAP